MSLEDEFAQALEDVNTLSGRPSNQDQLALYGLFKQVKVGDVSGARPPQYDMFDRAKYDAWKKLKGIDADEARQRYIDKVAALLAADQ